MDRRERRLTDNEYLDLTEYEKIILTKLNNLEALFI